MCLLCIKISILCEMSQETHLPQCGAGTRPRSESGSGMFAVSVTCSLIDTAYFVSVAWGFAKFLFHFFFFGLQIVATPHAREIKRII